MQFALLCNSLTKFITNDLDWNDWLDFDDNAEVGEEGEERSAENKKEKSDHNCDDEEIELLRGEDVFGGSFRSERSSFCTRVARL